MVGSPPSPIELEITGGPLKQDEKIHLGWFNFNRAASNASRISGRCC